MPLPSIPRLLGRSPSGTTKRSTWVSLKEVKESARDQRADRPLRWRELLEVRSGGARIRLVVGRDPSLAIEESGRYRRGDVGEVQVSQRACDQTGQERTHYRTVSLTSGEGKSEPTPCTFPSSSRFPTKFRPTDLKENLSSPMLE